TELEVEGIAFGPLDRVRGRDHLDPSTRIVDRAPARAARHLPERAKRRLDVAVLRFASPERCEASRERARCDGSAVTGENSLGETVPEVPPLEEEIRSRRGHRTEHCPL